jgi:hypothetical protein
MFFLLRMAFWLTIVLALLPSGGAQKGAPSAQIGTTDAVAAASAAVSDMSGFCGRQPDACEVGAQAAAVIGQRAQAGARLVYDFFSERVAHGTTGSVSSAKLFDSNTVPALRGTLTAADLDPLWQGPKVREHVPLPHPRRGPA